MPNERRCDKGVTVYGLRYMFLKWKEAFESKGLKVSLGKTNVMVRSRITKDILSKSEVCSLRVMATSVLCAQCGRCARLKRVTPKFLTKYTCRKCEENIGEAVEQEEKLCAKVETVHEFTYLGDRVSADFGCEAIVTVRTRCWWV